uniref:DNA 3'-5' helicase n=1 Tax=Caldimicrobium thiodismutans TaxID=1653476 RepID=A0A832GPT6_9BACT
MSLRASVETPLTPEQKEIVEFEEDLLVLAGPGCGKTFTLLEKVKRLLERGHNPEKILLLTFSLKVSQELKEKLKKSGLSHIKVDTFHGLAYDLWRDYYNHPPKLLSEEERGEILKKLYPGVKNPLKSPLEKQKYYEYLEKNKLLDFDFLLVKASELPLDFQNYFLFIDEFQDLSPEILKFLASLKDAVFYLFGDPNQCLYGFKGVNLAGIKEFLSKHKETMKTLTLSQSFRCPQEILHIAKRFHSSPWVIPDFKSHKKGGILQGFILPDEKEERTFLLSLCYQLLGGLSLERAHHHHIAPSEIFILSRIRKVSEPLKELFLREGIPVAFPEEEALNWKEALQSLSHRLETSPLPFEEICKTLSPQLQNILSNWYELWARDKEKLISFLKGIELYDLVQPSLEGINFLTIHASKGLEAEVVILLGAEEGLIPLKIFQDVDLEEEKRILYVGLTRTKRAFYFTATKSRRLFQHHLNQGLSGWLKDLPVKEFSKRPPSPKQRGLF